MLIQNDPELIRGQLEARSKSGGSSLWIVGAGKGIDHAMRISEGKLEYPVGFLLA